MSGISAVLVKELRERTGAGMMDCKKALTETGGNIDQAIDNMRKAGLAKALKKGGRVASEGIILVLTAPSGQASVLVEVNCETDFVAREAKFKEFAKQVANCALTQAVGDAAQLMNQTLPGSDTTVEAQRLSLVSQLGENITVRRVAFATTEGRGVLGAYGHGDANGTRIGAMVELSGGDADLARDLAMQVAAMNPEYLSQSEIPAARLEKEREIFTQQVREEGKGEDKLPMIVEGKVKKFAKDVTLLGQMFVKDPNTNVEALLKKAGAVVVRFTRFEVGEGIEKKTDNFVEEVMAQARGA